MSYFLLTRLARLLTLVLLGHRFFQLRGLDGVPRSGPLLIVSNHVGAVDPALIGAWAPRAVWFMAKSELFRGFFTRRLMIAYHAFPVVRHSADRKALRRAIDLLRAGQAVVLFPEGHRSDDGRLQRAQPGAGFLARHSGAPLVALGITGTERVLQRHHRLPGRAPVRMTFGPPFHIPERNPDGSPMNHQQTADYLMTKIAQLLPLEVQGPYHHEGPPASEAV
ncbi:MAG TPA: lysophospholipid acyltransferase family protein [Candidatus Limnocylindrales bacterium]|nr:lysophospholipid acyltransferase family protein [Candidatus Limnocylindrales bacterium]